jgi:hypothetical protein
MILLAIDPGNVESAYVTTDLDYKIYEFRKLDNAEMIDILKSFTGDCVAIEGIASYGMAVGKEVFETCVWSGRFIQTVLDRNTVLLPIFRKAVKMNLCGSARAKDSNIIQALKDRFGDKGTKANPGWFHGFKADCWQAYALAVTYIDMMKGLYKC